MEERKLGVLRTSAPANFLTYVRERIDTFAERPLCAIDSLVFSWLAYTRMNTALDAACTSSGIAFHELLRAEDFGSMFGTSWDEQGSRDLLFAVCASPRFRDVRLSEFRFKTDMGAEEQFAAMTFALPDCARYVAFRGTDSTLVGWKEDFNMTFLNPVPAQQEAARYLDEVAADTAGPLFVGGHSKGGNLAVYAASAASDACRARIERVFSHDGPGFHREYIAGEAYQRILPLVEKTVPKSAMISQVLSEDEACAVTVVESDGFSLLQHNPFMWHVDVEACAFVPASDLSASSRYFGAILDAWMDRYPLADRKRFVDTLFGVLGVTGAARFGDIMAEKATTIPLMLDAAEKLEPDEREFIVDVVKSFAKTATVERVADAASGLIDTIKPGRQD